MFYSDTIDESLYSEIMRHIKQINVSQMQSDSRIRQMHSGRVQRASRNLWANARSGHFLMAADYTMDCIRNEINRRKWVIKADKIDGSEPPPNYFSSEKIAIYTVITGGYDEVLEPYCKPDNCDLFLFTDREFDDTASAWNKRELPSCLDVFTNAEKNRYLKMHPHKLFSEYNYSVYVDGNIQIFTDLTEYINRLGSIGIGTHLHPDRQCVYKELEAVAARGKETWENTERHAAYLKKAGMPHNYGLLECNVIAREHHNDICVRIMEQWWREYEEYCKRDQVSLPHVLYQNNIQINEVGVLGENVRVNPSFRILGHNRCNSSEVMK